MFSNKPQLMQLKFLTVIFTIALLGGCSSMSGSRSTISLVDRNGLDAIAAPEGHQLVVVRDANSKERYCLAPPSDAVIDRATSLSLPVPNLPLPISAASPNISNVYGTPATPTPSPSSTGISLGGTPSDLNLGGRTPNVLIVRESFYRLCELGLNADLTTDQLIDLFRLLTSVVQKALLPQ